MSRSLLTQAPRHLPAWLIFDVRRNQTNTMPEPVTTISALIALTQSLAASHKDRKFLADIHAIQELAARFQADYFRIEKECLHLHTDLAQQKQLVISLQARLSELEKSDADLKVEKAKVSELMSRIEEMEGRHKSDGIQIIDSTTNCDWDDGLLGPDGKPL
jgi:hypothetical protein